MVTICLVEHLYLLCVVIVPVGNIVDVQPVVLQVEPGVRPTAPHLHRKYFNPKVEINISRELTRLVSMLRKEDFNY